MILCVRFGSDFRKGGPGVPPLGMPRVGAVIAGDMIQNPAPTTQPLCADVFCRVTWSMFRTWAHDDEVDHATANFLEAGWRYRVECGWYGAIWKGPCTILSAQFRR